MRVPQASVITTTPSVALREGDQIGSEEGKAERERLKDEMTGLRVSTRLDWTKPRVESRDIRWLITAEACRGRWRRYGDGKSPSGVERKSKRFRASS